MRCHDPHAAGAYPVTASGMKPPASPRHSGHSARFPAFPFSARGFPPVPSRFRFFRRPPARTAGSPPGYVMGCHDRHAGSTYPVAVSGMQPPVLPRRSRYSIRFSHLPVFGMRLSSRFAFVPFSPPPAPPGSGSLYRAYPARARAPVGAGAVRAPDCARGRGRTSPVGFSRVFKKLAPLGCAAPGKRLRMPLPSGPL